MRLVAAIALIVLLAPPLARAAEGEKLASHPHWLALLHYKKGRSEIVSPEFFLSPEGATNPAAELAATIAALAQPVGSKPDEHAQCRFVARYKWLRRMGALGSALPQARCPGFQAFSMNGKVQSLSLVYASGFLSNPASFYGHILVKFNSPADSVVHDLLDQSVNFGAAVPQNENTLRYIAYGLFGGYVGTFSHQLFYNFDHLYAENELRDLWEYRLDLRADEVETLVAHSWELLGKHYRYYFLKENCAWRMAELLEMVVAERLLPDVPYALPGVVFERIASVTHHGKPLVREIRRIPSRQSRYREAYRRLAPREQDAATRLVAANLDFAAEPYAALDEPARVRVVDLLLDYYEYRHIRERKSEEMKGARQRLLVERGTLPARKGFAERDARPSGAPTEGPLPFMLRLGASHNGASGNGVSLHVRPANFDALSIDDARIAHATLSMFDVKAVLREERAELRHFHLVSIENPNAAATPLPLDGGLAWKVQFGLQAHSLACAPCTVPKATGGLGKSFALSDSLLFGMADVSAQASQDGSGTLSITPHAGAVLSLQPSWKVGVMLGRRSFLNGARESYTVGRLESRFGAQRSWDVRLSYERNVAHEAEIALSLYW